MEMKQTYNKCLLPKVTLPFDFKRDDLQSTYLTSPELKPQYHQKKKRE
jgi:hypothetical protein